VAVTARAAFHGAAARNVALGAVLGFGRAGRLAAGSLGRLAVAALLKARGQLRRHAVLETIGGASAVLGLPLGAGRLGLAGNAPARAEAPTAVNAKISHWSAPCLSVAMA
jgi:hypothetical protein